MSGQIAADADQSYADVSKSGWAKDDWTCAEQEATGGEKGESSFHVIWRITAIAQAFALVADRRKRQKKIMAPSATRDKVEGSGRPMVPFSSLMPKPGPEVVREL